MSILFALFALFALLALVVFLGIFENRQHHVIAILDRHAGLPLRLMQSRTAGIMQKGALLWRTLSSIDIWLHQLLELKMQLGR